MSATAEEKALAYKAMRRAISRRYRQKNLAELRAKDAAKKRQRRLDDSAYRERGRIASSRRFKHRTAAQKQRDAEVRRAWMAAHPEYKEQNLAQLRAVYDPAKKKRYRDANKPRLHAYLHAYYRKHKERFVNAARARRALKKASAVNLRNILAFTQSIKAKPFATCYYCHARVSSKSVHFDHIIALSKGGPHSVENLCVSCADCNLSKGAKPMLEWARANAMQQLLNL